MEGVQAKKTIALAAQYGTKVLVVHGANVDRVHWLIMACTTADLTTKTVQCCHEPRIGDIEQALVAVEGFHPSVVIALGGGSVMDFGKALAALIPCDGSPQEYLEIVGNGRQLEHVSIPMIALPTTAGTEAKVTNNGLVPVKFRSLSSNVCYEGDMEWQRDTQTRFAVMRFAWRQRVA